MDRGFVGVGFLGCARFECHYRRILRIDFLELLEKIIGGFEMCVAGGLGGKGLLVA